MFKHQFVIYSFGCDEMRRFFLPSDPTPVRNRHGPVSIIFVLALCVLVILGSTASTADSGIIVPRPDLKGVDEHLQSAIIAWDGNVERLILSVTIGESPEWRTKDGYSDLNVSEGNLSNKAVRVIPFPTEPEVEQVDPKVFDRAQDVVNDYIDSLWEFSGLDSGKGDSEGMGGMGSSDKSHLRIVFQKQLGYHGLVCIKVQTPEAFVGFAAEKLGLGADDFNIEYRNQMYNISRDYLRRGISFFVFDELEIPDDTSTIKPLMYTFNSSYLYYPMQISNLASYIGGISLMLLTERPVDISPAQRHGLKEDIGGFLDPMEGEKISDDIGEMFPDRLAFSYLQNDEARWRDYHDRYDERGRRYSGDIVIDSYDDTVSLEEYEKGRIATILLFLAFYGLFVGIVVIEWFKGPKLRLGKGKIEFWQYAGIVRRSRYIKRIKRYYTGIFFVGIVMILLIVIVINKIISTPAGGHPFFPGTYPFFLSSIIGTLCLFSGLLSALSYKISFDRGKRYLAIPGVLLPIGFFIQFSCSLTVYRDGGVWKGDLTSSMGLHLVYITILTLIFTGLNISFIPFRTESKRWMGFCLIVLGIIMFVFTHGSHLFYLYNPSCSGIHIDKRIDNNTGSDR